MHPLPAWLCALAGSWCGISLSYTIGRTLGIGVVHRYGKYLHIPRSGWTACTVVRSHRPLGAVRGLLHRGLAALHGDCRGNFEAAVSVLHELTPGRAGYYG